MQTRMFRFSALAVAAFFAAPLSTVDAHGVVIGRNAAGQLRVLIEVPMPIPLPPSPFPGIPGWADAEPGIASAEIDEPSEDLYQLDPNCNVQFELVGTDPGVQIVTSHVWVPGETIDFGAPFFDYHLIFNIPGGEIGVTYAIRFRLRDLNGVHGDSPLLTLLFTRAATSCSCRGDMDSDAALTGADVQSFIACFTQSAPGEPPGPGCSCADLDADGALDGADVAMFVGRLLASDSCL